MTPDDPASVVQGDGQGLPGDSLQMSAAQQQVPSDCLQGDETLVQAVPNALTRPKSGESVACGSGAPPCSAISVQSALAEIHGTTVCKVRDVFSFVLMIAAFCAVLWAVNSQSHRLVAVSRFIRDLGPLGHFVYFLLFIWVGLPFGYNWSTLVILVGFSYGWAGLIDTHIGTITSCVMNFVAAKRWGKGCLEKWVNRLGPRKRQYLWAVRHVIEKEKAGFMMLILLRGSPVTTFGLENAVLGSFCNISVMRFASSSYLGLIRGIIMCTNAGVLVGKMGSLDAVTSSSEGQREVLINIIMWLVFFLGLFVFFRYLVVRVLPRLISEGLVIEVPDAPTDAKEQSLPEREPPEPEELPAP